MFLPLARGQAYIRCANTHPSASVIGKAPSPEPSLARLLFLMVVVLLLLLVAVAVVAVVVVVGRSCFRKAQVISQNLLPGRLFEAIRVTNLMKSLVPGGLVVVDDVVVVVVVDGGGVIVAVGCCCC